MDDEPRRTLLGVSCLGILWTYATYHKNPALERPQISQLWILFLSAVLAFAVSFGLKWLAARRGRFDDNGDSRRLEESRRTLLPRRPSKIGTWLLAACIVTRLQLVWWLQPQLHCSNWHVEALLPLLLAVYDKFVSRKSPLPSHADDEDDQIDNDAFQDIAAWFMRSHVVNYLGAGVLWLGVSTVFKPDPNSNVICAASVSRSRIIALQLVGLILDAAILIVARRRVQWARSSSDRFKELSVIFTTPCAIFSCATLLQYGALGQSLFSELLTLDTLYCFHMIQQSFVFVLVSYTLLRLNHLASAVAVVSLCAAHEAWRRMSLLGTFDQLSKAQVNWGLVLLGISVMILAARNQLRLFGVSRRLLLLAITTWVFGALIYSAIKRGVLDRHPVDKLIYAARTEGDRWLVQKARVSESLGVAVREYLDRHAGRKPPPNFDKWYDFATAQNSIIIDHFPQIDDDLLPFWSVKPSRIVAEVSKLKAIRGISMVSIKDGAVVPPISIESPLEPTDEVILRELVELIGPFAKHLPDMDLPVNLLDQPRVLAPWSGGPAASLESIETKTGTMWSLEHQHQLGQACPASSQARAGFYAQNGWFCWSCTAPQSEGQFLSDVALGRDLCHQPDMFNLHGFYISHQPLRPLFDLVPVFSRAKTNQYSDILIPLGKGSTDYGEIEHDKPLHEKANQLFWRGQPGSQSLPLPPAQISGGHQARLSHLINNASKDDSVTMLLAISGDKNRFQYQKTPLLEANRALKFDVGIGDYSLCGGAGCEELMNELGIKPKTDDDEQTKMNSRYVIVMDGDQASPRDFLQVLKSSSVPLVASVFKEWYTDRLFPWLHYVPIDVRLHGLHSTLAYFMGLLDKGIINGQNVPMSPATENALWISQEGKRRAHEAIRREDAQVYLFRLLLEWGRVIDEKREELGYAIQSSG